MSNPLNPETSPCQIFFHIPKTGGQTFHNLFLREHGEESTLNTHCGLMSRPAWGAITDRLATDPRRTSYRAVTGHMVFGMHEMLGGPVNYITLLREPVGRFISYYSMLARMGHAPADLQIDPDRPNWNLSGHESIPRELDNGQTRALAGADLDLPFGQCGEEHLKMAQANLERHFTFAGLTEQFDLSLMLLKRLHGWRWHFYAKKNVTPCSAKRGFSSRLLEGISELNRFDRQLHAYVGDRLAETARSFGLSLRLEHGAYLAGNRIHRGIHSLRHLLKSQPRRVSKPVNAGLSEPAEIRPELVDGAS